LLAFFEGCDRLLEKTVATCIAGQFFSERLLRDVISSAAEDRTNTMRAAAASANYTLQTMFGEDGIPVF
jgi:hypothetical protein